MDRQGRTTPCSHATVCRVAEGACFRVSVKKCNQYEPFVNRDALMALVGEMRVATGLGGVAGTDEVISYARHICRALGVECDE